MSSCGRSRCAVRGACCPRSYPKALGLYWDPMPTSVHLLASLQTQLAASQETVRLYEAKGRRAAKAASEYKAQLAELAPKHEAAEAELLLLRGQVEGLMREVGEAATAAAVPVGPAADVLRCQQEAACAQMQALEAALAESESRCSGLANSAQLRAEREVAAEERITSLVQRLEAAEGGGMAARQQVEAEHSQQLAVVEAEHSRLMSKLRAASEEVQRHAATATQVLEGRVREAEHRAAEWQARALEAEENRAGVWEELGASLAAFPGAACQVEAAQQRGAALAGEMSDLAATLSLLLGASSSCVGGGGGPLGSDDRGLLSQLSETQAALRSLTAQYEASVAREQQLQGALTGAEARCAEEQQKQAALVGAEARCTELQSARSELQQQLAEMSEEAAACRCEVVEVVEGT